MPTKKRNRTIAAPARAKQPMEVMTFRIDTMLLRDLDRAAGRLHLTRSAFIIEAVTGAVRAAKGVK